MSRDWQAVSKAIQQLAAGRYAVKSEAMFLLRYALCSCDR